jgi:hypothetical protein
VGKKIGLQGLRKEQWWMETGLFKGLRRVVGKKGGCKGWGRRWTRKGVARVEKGAVGDGKLAQRVDVGGRWARKGV